MVTKNDASVLAFEKKLVPSDGFLYGTTWSERTQAKSKPLPIIEKSVRGTISNRLKATLQNDPLKLNAEVEKPNPQKIDACALSEDQDTLHLRYTLKILGGVERPSACNGVNFNKSYPIVAKSYIEKSGFVELARRYATNIVNGRYLWRNRVGAKDVEVVVSNTSNNSRFTFNATEFPLSSFDSKDPNLAALTEIIADALSGKTSHLLISIDTFALIGKAQEVYPSEELVMDKGKGDKSKILYQVNGVAAMHSQKIGNALRTIDTWYPEIDTANIGPIAIEPYGAVTNLGKAFRTPKGKADFYTLFDRFALGEKLNEENEEHYVMAVLVRGGVFGQSGKE